jgi:hypothetical protein
LPKIPYMEVILIILYFILFSWMLLKIPFFKNIPGLSYRILMLFFALKILAGILMIQIYTHIYDLEIADFHKYYRDGMVLYGVLKESPLDFFRILTGIQSSADHLVQYYDQMDYWNRPWETPVYNDNRVVIRFNALAAVFSFGSLYIHNIFINFLSLSGLVAIYKFVLRYADKEKLLWLLPGIFLFPGMLFWGSGILKEGLLIWAFGYWIFYSDKIFAQRFFRFSYLIYFAFFSFFLFMLKPYALALWLPCMVGFYLGMNNKPIKIVAGYIISFAVFFIIMVAVGWIFPQYDFIQILVNKQNNFVNHALALDAGSIIHTRYIDTNLWHLFLEFWRGLFYSFFRPHLLEAYSAVVWFATLENMAIWGMFLWTIFHFDKESINKYPVFWLCLFYVILLMGFVGMVTPLHGAIVRYKIPALPFLWVFWVHMTRLPDYKKITNSRVWNFFNK